MAEFLVIRLGDNSDDLAHWIAVDSSGARRSPPVTGPLAEAAHDIGDRKVIVMVPSVDVLTTSVDIPVKGAKLHAALPYALEETVAEDIDTLHFASGARRTGGQVPVSVISREKMEQWLERLRDAGISAWSLMADSYGLARIPGTISMLVADQNIFINDGANVELAIQGVSPGEALTAIGALDNEDTDSDRPEDDDTALLPRHVLVYCEVGEEQRYQHDWIAIRQELDSLDVKILPDGVMPRLAVTVANGAGVNLLQGEYAVRAEYSGMFKPWRNAAMLLVAFALVGIGAKATDYFLLKRQQTALQAKFQEEYRQILPGAPEVMSPGPAIQSLKTRFGSKTEAIPVFLESMEQLSKALQQNESAQIEAISYRNGVIDIRIKAPNVSTLDNIQKQVSDGGRFSATIQSTDQDGDSVNSRIQIQATGP